MTEIVLLDGGLGQELVHRCGDPPTPQWSSQVMEDHPGLVQAIHRDYLDAGATLTTTNSYSLHRDRLEGTPLAERFDALLGRSLDEAHAAREAAGGRGRIAGALGPLIGSYRPEDHPPVEEAVPRYAEVAAQLAPRVDVLLGETVASLTQADAILRAAEGLGKPVWISVTVDDHDGARLRSGAPVAALREVVAGRADAVLANCSMPEAMGEALEELRTLGLPFGAYANGFTAITEAFRRDWSTVESLEARRAPRA